MYNNFNKTVYCIILNYNGKFDTERCINSLLHVEYKPINLVVVDNNSTDDSVEYLSSRFPSIKILKTSNNNGYAAGMNVGINYALKLGAEYILILNNDTTFEINFLDPMVNLLNNKPDAGIISPKVLYMHDNNKIYCAGGKFKLHLCSAVSMFQGKDAKKYGNEEREIDLAEGCCFLAHKKVFRNAGFIPEHYFMYFEDIDFSDNVRKFFKIYYTPKSIIYHKSGAGTSWSAFSPLYYYYYTRNRFYYFKKYNIFIKSYVFLFASVNTLAKSLILLKNLFLKRNKHYLSSFKMLIKGYFDGVKYIMQGYE